MDRVAKVIAAQARNYHHHETRGTITLFCACNYALDAFCDGFNSVVARKTELRLPLQ
jgi:hypothetical protein